MSRQTTQYGLPLASTTRTTTYSRSRPLPPPTNSHVSALTKNFQSTSITNRTRTPTRLNHRSPERTLRSNLPTGYRTRLPSLDRSVSLY
jgi:hypothetical protein